MWPRVRVWVLGVNYYKICNGEAGTKPEIKRVECQHVTLIIPSLANNNTPRDKVNISHNYAALDKLVDINRCMIIKKSKSRDVQWMSLSLWILFVYFSSLLHPSILFNCFYTCTIIRSAQSISLLFSLFSSCSTQLITNAVNNHGLIIGIMAKVQGSRFIRVPAREHVASSKHGHSATACGTQCLSTCKHIPCRLCKCSQVNVYWLRFVCSRDRESGVRLFSCPTWFIFRQWLDSSNWFTLFEFKAYSVGRS